MTTGSEELIVTDLADLAWRSRAGYFDLRVAAIIVRDRHILTTHVPGRPYSFLPGGRVPLGEVTREALARELAEELGVPLPIRELALVSENLFVSREPCHELCFYYRANWPAGLSPDHVNAGAEERHRCTWTPMDRLRSVPFQPVALVDHLLALPRSVGHVVWSDRRGGAGHRYSEGNG